VHRGRRRRPGDQRGVPGRQLTLTPTPTPNPNPSPSPSPSPNPNPKQVFLGGSEAGELLRSELIGAAALQLLCFALGGLTCRGTGELRGFGMRTYKKVGTDPQLALALALTLALTLTLC
jgi:hypothetical protein